MVPTGGELSIHNRVVVTGWPLPSLAFAPGAPPVQRVYYQVDSWTVLWQAAPPHGHSLEG